MILISRSVGSVVQVMILRNHKDISRRLVPDGARSMPSGRKSAGTFVSFACGDRFGAREDSKLHKLMGACIRISNWPILAHNSSSSVMVISFQSLSADTMFASPVGRSISQRVSETSL